MDANVAGRAVLVSRIGHVMFRALNPDPVALAPEAARAIVTLQAQGKHDRPQQQSRIGRPMRSMASLASIYTNTKMLEKKGSTLIRMALQAGLFIRHRLVHVARTRRHAPGRGKRAVRVVTIGARDHAFLNAMLERHSELRAYVRVAFFAQRCLRLSEQSVKRLRAVDGMATGAGHTIQGVLRGANIGARKRLAMAA